VRAPRATKAKAVSAGPGWPWSPVTKFEDADVFALQAIAAGNASAGQQQRALAFIREAICEDRRLSFMPGGEDGRRASDFAEGKRFVGIQIQRFLNMTPTRINTRGAPPAMPAAAPAVPEPETST
jgi:hypothetical protein